MHQIPALLLTLLFLILTGCEDKKPEQNAIPVENTTTVITTKQKTKTEEIKEVGKTTAPTVKTAEETFTKAEKNSGDTFSLLDMQEKRYTATVVEDRLTFQDNTKPIVLIQFFATWCAPCVGEIAYLNDLQEVYKKDLFVTAVLTRDKIDTSALNAFSKEHHISYKVLHSKDADAIGTTIAQELDIQGTFPIPLMVIYLNGKYYTHYEGSVPVEMVKYDIQQAQQQLQKN